MKFKKIGEVRSEYKKSMVPYDYNFFKNFKSKIIIFDEYKKGLTGLKKGDFIEVICYFDRVSPDKVKLDGIHPRGIKSNPATGLFNTRSPNRINPIGITTVKIINISDNILEVVGLDVFDKSPVIDIKSYRMEKGKFLVLNGLE